MRRWSAGLVACAVAVPMLVAGCSSKHQASQSLPTASRTTASQTLPPLGPADFPVPAEARTKTPAGVIAFTRYYVELLNRQKVSLDTSPISELSQNCQTCSELVKSYDDTRLAEHRFAGGTLTVEGTGSAVVSGNAGETSFVLRQEPTQVLDKSGAVVESRSLSVSKFSGGVRLSWDDDRSTWVMVQFDADPL